MRSSIGKSLALLIAGLGLSAPAALADPKSGIPAKSDPPAKVDPKPAVLPKADPKPILLPKDDPKPLPIVPKVDPKPLPIVPKADPKPPPIVPKVDPKPLPIVPKADPKPLPVDPKLLLKPLPMVDPKLPIVPVKPDGKLLPTPEAYKPLIHEKPKTGGPVEMQKGPGLKLPAGTKVDRAELAKIKPPIDLTKTKPEVVLASKPPTDFKVKPVKLDSIHVPKDAPVVAKLNITSIKNVTVNQTFVMNQSYYTGGDYHTKYGTKMSYGYCYPGKLHSHWHHCIWDPCFNCNYFYCPSACCYYYWCEGDYHWFVDYGTCYYPWWICGGFSGYGYVAQPTISIFIGW